MKIDINEVKALKSRLREINKLEFRDIVWVDGDKELEIPKQFSDDWEFTGLNNADFIYTGFYLEGFCDD